MDLGKAERGGAGCAALSSAVKTRARLEGHERSGDRPRALRVRRPGQAPGRGRGPGFARASWRKGTALGPEDGRAFGHWEDRALRARGRRHLRVEVCNLSILLTAYKDRRLMRYRSESLASCCTGRPGCPLAGGPALSTSLQTSVPGTRGPSPCLSQNLRLSCRSSQGGFSARRSTPPPALGVGKRPSHLPSLCQVTLPGRPAAQLWGMEAGPSSTRPCGSICALVKVSAGKTL